MIGLQRRDGNPTISGCGRMVRHPPIGGVSATLVGCFELEVS
jgi:hypothetical protein